MSAITGIFYRDGRKVDPDQMKKMNDRLSHRGKDGSAIWCQGSVGLGHQMLWTTPESLQEKLPFHDEKAGLVITADARIDNRKELSQELSIEDKEDVSDSYFILKSYEKWGEKCPEYLLGDFAFAIWDENEEKLFCARDHMGVKPFYYYLDDEIFVFGTEIKALFCVNNVPIKLNEFKIALYLKMIRTDKKFTFYKDILSLTSAHFLLINHDKSSKKKYWELDPNMKIIMNSDEEYFQAFHDIFVESINCRLRTVFPIGFDLSGGLDSSSVVCMAKKIIDKDSKGNIKTFSEIYDNFPECDERNYIKKVVNKGAIESNLIKCDDISPLDEIETLLFYQDQPFHTPFLSFNLQKFKKMNNKSIRIYLNGFGGDLIISHAKDYFIELAITFKWKKLIKELISSSKRAKKSFYNEFVNKVIFPLIPECIKIMFKPIWNFIKLTKNQNKIIFGLPEDFLNENFSDQIKINTYKKKMEFKCKNSSKTAKEAHYISIFTYSIQEEFEVREKIVGDFDIEPRFPYYDKRLVEFCYGIPTEIKYKSGWDRFILRSSMKDILPKEIQWRPNKINLISLLKKNLFLFEKNRLEKILYENNELINNYVDLDSIQKIYQEYSKNNAIAYTHVLHFWQIMVLSEWLKNFNLKIKS